ncbi:hypothetical protein ACP3TJ_04995 [Desulforudis sp. 1088]|uniref:hypothetical protein n=1 Tax=unclassified Candidatus Desulforudis TaxID=2635950 RepID=UPI003BE45746
MRIHKSQWLERRRQWERFAAWERTGLPDNGDTAVRLRRVGEMMDLWLGLHAENERVSRSGVSGIRIMRKKLGKVRVCRDRI